MGEVKGMVKVLLLTFFVGLIGNGLTVYTTDVDIGSILAIMIMGGTILYRLDQIEQRIHPNSENEKDKKE